MVRYSTRRRRPCWWATACFYLTIAFTAATEPVCENLKTKLSYKQENAPKDISAVLRVVVEKVNRELDGVIDVDVGWNGGGIQRVVGSHFVLATVTRLFSSLESDNISDDDRDKMTVDRDGRRVITQCFSVQFVISDTNECALPLGHDMRHRCVLPSACLNTVGSYECACPVLSYVSDSMGVDLHDGLASTPDDAFWADLSSSVSSRTPWDLSLPLTTAHCPSLPSTWHCCAPDAHTSVGGDCRFSFRCPTDPCAADPCDASATCTRADVPTLTTDPSHSCACPSSTLGTGRRCRPGIDPPPAPTVTHDGVTPTAETANDPPCGCTTPVVDVCAGPHAHCRLPNEVCAPDARGRPACGCRTGYVRHDEYGCVDLTPPTLRLRCDDEAHRVLRRGDSYEECAVDVLDENAEEYARNLKISYSRPLSPGRCLTELGTFTVNYTVGTPWTDPPFVGVLRTVEVLDRDVCAIKRENYGQWCDEILPKCDVENGAECESKRGGWTCRCPEGMVGDGVLTNAGGNGCVDRKPPSIELVGANPRVFKVCSCGGLKGYLTNVSSGNDSNLGKNSVRTKEEQMRNYEANLLSMIKSTAGAELCATSSNSSNACVRATDETYRGSVDLTSRVTVGTPIRMSSSAKNGEFRWKVPYDVTDDADNKAITQYREIKVVEMNLEELEVSIRQDVMQQREREIEEAVESALQREREIVAAAQSKQQRGRKAVAAPACPACPKCKTCRSNNSISPDSCRDICQQMNESCDFPTTTSTIATTWDSTTGLLFMTTEWFVNMGSIVLGIAVLLILCRMYSWSTDNGAYYSKVDEERERALANSVTYYRTPEHSVRGDNNRGDHTVTPGSSYNINMQSATAASNGVASNGGPPPPPRASMSYTSTSSSGMRLQHTSNNAQTTPLFSPHGPNGTRDHHDIYESSTPITPSRSRGERSSTSPWID